MKSLFLHLVQEFGHSCHQGHEAGVELEFEGHPGYHCPPLSPVVREVQGRAVVKGSTQGGGSMEATAAATPDY